MSVTISIAWLAVLAKTLKMSSLLQLTDLEEKLQMVERRQKNRKLLIIRHHQPAARDYRQKIIKGRSEARQEKVKNVNFATLSGGGDDPSMLIFFFVFP